MTDPADQPAEDQPEGLPPTTVEKELTLTADTLGNGLLVAMLEELRAAPDCWERLSEDKQNAIIDRMRQRTEVWIGEALRILLGAQSPAIPAQLLGVSVGKGLKLKIDVARSAPNRHDLIDAVNKQIMIVIADPDLYTGRMSEIRAAAKQQELFGPGVTIRDGYTGPAEQPYRRGDASPPDGSPEPGSEPVDPPEPPADLELVREPLWKQAQDAVAAHGIHVDDYTASMWTEDQCTEAAFWAQLVSSTTKGRKPPRPKFLPPPAETAH